MIKGKKNDIYLPLKSKIIDIITMTPDIKLFKINPSRRFYYKPGNFIMLSLWGKGEIPISIASTCDPQKYIEICIRRVGYVTSALHMLEPEAEIGIRGPYGNTFPIERAKGNHIIFIAGGVGLAPLRPLMHKVMNEKNNFKSTILICGSRDPDQILFKDEINTWQKRGLQVMFGVRKGIQNILNFNKKNKSIKGRAVLEEEYKNIPKISFKNSFAFICGPPVMIDFAMKNLNMIGIDENNIFTSLEAHMKCGVGKCGHCNITGKYICTEGPIFSYGDIKKYNLFSL